MSGVDLRPLNTAPLTIYTGTAIPDALAKAIEEQQERALQLYGLCQVLELAVEHRDRIRDLDAAMGAATECASALYQLLDCGTLEKRAKEITEEQAAEAEEEDVTRRADIAVTDDKLRDAITLLDRFSQEATEQIATIARLGLAEAKASGASESLMAGLTMIENRANELSNDINAEAEAVGANYKSA